MIKKRTLEELFDDIGKDMCHIDLMYPNDGRWHIYLSKGYEDLSFSSETLYDALILFESNIKNETK